jgi:hypothetical protein
MTVNTTIKVNMWPKSHTYVCIIEYIFILRYMFRPLSGHHQAKYKNNFLSYQIRIRILDVMYAMLDILNMVK